MDPKMTQLLNEGKETLLYLAYPSETGQPVVLKLPKNKLPLAETLRALDNEYELTAHLELAGVRKALGRERLEDKEALVLEYVSGQTVAAYFKETRRSLAEFLTVAINIADLLEKLHQQHLVHKNITGENILIETETGAIRLIDFGLAARLKPRSQLPANPEKPEGTLTHLAPEQTGRMNRLIDYRADLYSLGITFYEMLTGEPPFVSDDPLEVIHSHIARLPESPQRKNQAIPEALAAIVLHLLEKNADDRYQSAHGVKHDLETGYHQLIQTGQIAPFPLAEEDYLDHLLFPQKLYGRESDLRRLFGAFERARGGRAELLLLAGYAGVGKTVLVRELRQSATEKRGFYTEGKFDQYQRNVPYLAWIQALTALVNQLLMLGEAELAAWKTRLQAAVGANGKMLTDLVPNLKLVIGEQPVVAELGGMESQNRFNYVFQNFIKAIAGPEHPLVIFLDDLQWIDDASLKLLKALLTEPELAHFLAIGAYRDNEVDEAHPLHPAIDALRREQVKLTCLTLQNLTQADVNALISDTLRCPPADSLPLTQLTYAKTAGNAFFIQQLFHSLTEQALLTFAVDKRCWQWSLAELNTITITDNVVELMLTKMQGLSQSMQNILKLAACIGNQFDLATLTLIAEKPAEVTGRELALAMQEGFLFPLNGFYRFVHDHVQQAGYSLMTEAERKAAHWRIGRLLYLNTPAHLREERLFELVNHLNIGLEFIASPAEKSELAALNLQAGKKAKAALAYDVAARYLHTGLALTSPAQWATAYPLLLELFKEAVETEYLNTNYLQAETLADEALVHAQTPLDQAGLIQLKLLIFTQKPDYRQALDAGLAVLKLLKVDLVDQPPADLVIDQLLNLPPMTDPTQLMAMKIMITLMAPAYILEPTLYLTLTYSMLNLSREYGNAPASTYAYGTYGSTLIAAGDIEQGYRLGQMARQLVDRLNVPEMKCRVLNMFNSCIRHWREHLPTAVADMAEGVTSGLDYGDVENASYCAIHYGNNLFFAGLPLDSVEFTVRYYLALMEKLKQGYAVSFLKITRQTLLNLKSSSPEAGRLAGEIVDEQELLPVLLATKSYTILFWFYTAKVVLNYLFNNFPTAVANAQLAQPLAGNSIGLIAVGQLNFYHSLAILAQYPAADRAITAPELAQVEANQTALAGWAKHAPLNYRHKYQLVEAEKARALGQTAAAMAGYEQAIQGARQTEFIQEEAIACELAGKFYGGLGLAEIAQLYLTKAYNGYIRWQAAAKAEDLVRRYPHWLAHKSAPVEKNAATGSLDIGSVTKAAQAISGEIELEKLLTSLMRVVIENAGAQKGFLILEEDGQWVIEASGEVDNPARPLSPSILLEASDEVSVGIVHYVTRTHQNVILDDAAHEGDFSSDAHILNHKPKSVLCVPLMTQGHLNGALYLENNLTTGAFTPDRVRVLEILAGQAAISLENARYYETLKQLNLSLEGEIIERARVEKALRHSEQIHRTISEFISDYVYSGLVYPDGNVQTEWTAGAFERITGYTFEEINALEGKFASIVYPEDFSAIFETKPDQSTVHEYRITTKGGEMRWLRDYMKPVGGVGGAGVKRFLGAVQDITERKRAEEEKANLEAQLLQAQKLESVGRLAGGVAHDFNNILGVIMGHAELAMMRTNPAERVYAHLQEIHQSAERSADLTRQLLTFARKQTIAPKVLDLNDTVAGMLKMLHRLIGEDIDLVWCPAKEIWPVKMDPSQIDQILVNLGVNARDAIAGVGKVTIETGQISFDQAYCATHLGVQPGDFVLLAVSDNGCGMDRKTMAMIFEPFFTTKELGKGTGLGLATVYGIIKQNQGFINVYSEPNQGTTFRIYLPRHIGAGEVTGTDKRAEPIESGHETILLVEDEPAVLEMTKTILEMLGYTVLIAPTPGQAIRMVSEQPGEIHLLITDVVMPEMNGRDLAKNLLAFYPHLKCLFMSGYTANVIAHHGVLDEGVSFIQKPFSMKDLAAKVREMLDYHPPAN